MNPSNKQAMELALCQPQILEDCTKNTYTSIAFSNTNKKYLNSCNTLKTITFEGIGGDDYPEKLEQMLIIDRDQISGIFFGIPFNSHGQLISMIDSIPSEWFDCVVYYQVFFRVVVPYTTSDDTYVLLSKTFNDIFQKLLNMKMFIINIPCREFWDDNGDPILPLVAINYGEMLVILLHTMQSNKMMKISLRYKGIKTTTHLYSNLDEQIITSNFPNLKKISFDFCLKYDEAESCFEECQDIIKESTNKFLRPKQLHAESNNLATLLKFNEFLGEKYKDNKLLITITNFPDLFKTFRISNPNRNCNLQMVLCLDSPLTRNFLLSENSQEKCKENRLKTKSSILLNSYSFNMTELYLFSGTTFVLPDQRISLFKESLCLFSPFLTTLSLEISEFHVNDIGEKLASAYPHLKKLILSEYNNSYQLYDTDFFVRFTELELLHLNCIKFREFEYPASLKILRLTCASHRNMFPHPKPDNIQQLKNVNFDNPNNNNCLCYKRKELFNSCSAFYSFDKVVYCLHYKMKNDLQLFYTQPW
uniref:Uncharacterized protein n=1 Tax=Rhabditophanes sp. KR3021 TaxID=114890 RepID=A0AC35TVQ6_9BILA